MLFTILIILNVISSNPFFEKTDWTLTYPPFPEDVASVESSDKSIFLFSTVNLQNGGISDQS